MSDHAFNPAAYLAHYYGEVSHENRWLLDVLGRFYGTIPHGGVLLEIGGGPTLYQLIPAALAVDSFIFTDVDDSNLAEVRRWKYYEKDSFNWTVFFDYVSANQHDKKISGASIAEILRAKLQKIDLFDAGSSDAWKSIISQKISIVSTLFCLDAIAICRDEMLCMLIKIKSVLSIGGFLVIGVLRNCRAYRVGTSSFCTICLNEISLGDLLRDADFELLDIDSIDATGADGYDGLILALARTKLR